MKPLSQKRRDGAVAVLVAVALVALLGAVAMSLDVGALIMAAQRTQNTADAAALAAATSDMSGDEAAARARAAGLVTANRDTMHMGVTSNSADTLFYYGGQTVPGYRLLTGMEEAVQVTVSEPVKFNFAPIVGIYSSTAVRRATAARLFAAGAPVLPMWIGAGTPCNYGVTQDLHQVDSPGADLWVPGNFGWLDPVGDVDWNRLLSGYNLTEAEVLASYVEVGDLMSGLTGQRVGQWMKDLGDSGTGRLARATWEPWAGETFANHRNDNPRILVVPMVEWVGGGGTGAGWQIDKFGVFWLEAVRKHGNDGVITGRFIDFGAVGGSGGYTDYLGLWTTKLVR